MREPSTLKIEREHNNFYLCPWYFSLKEARKIHAWFGKLIPYLEWKEERALQQKRKKRNEK